MSARKQQKRRLACLIRSNPRLFSAAQGAASALSKRTPTNGQRPHDSCMGSSLLHHALPGPNAQMCGRLTLRLRRPQEAWAAHTSRAPARSALRSLPWALQKKRSRTAPVAVKAAPLGFGSLHGHQPCLLARASSQVTRFAGGFGSPERPRNP